VDIQRRRANFDCKSPIDLTDHRHGWPIGAPRPKSATLSSAYASRSTMPLIRLQTVRLRPTLLTAVFIYPASEAPHYRIGYKAALAFGLACLVFTTVFAIQDRRLRARMHVP
jgi:hypothetical protein